MDIILTNHAKERAKERLGLSKDAIARLAGRAFRNGVNYRDTRGQLHGYILKRINRYKSEGTNIRLYGETVFVFVDVLQNDTNEVSPVLVTVFKIPKKLMNHSFAASKKKEKKLYGEDEDELSY